MHTSSMFADSKLSNFSHQDRQTHDWLMLSAVMLYAAWLSNGNWEKWNEMLCSSEQPVMGRNLDTKSSYEGEMLAPPEYFENQVPQIG
jgi:hypothetical protein